MKTYARIENGIVAEIISVPQGFALDQLYPADFRAKCIACTSEVRQGWTCNGSSFAPPVPPQPTPEQLLAAFTAAIQNHLDSFARTRNYDGILSAATYATSTVPKFAAEGQYAVEARDATWATAYAILADVEGGKRPMPTIEAVVAELPVLKWPGQAQPAEVAV